jgi:hypothetical protein
MWRIFPILIALVCGCTATHPRGTLPPPGVLDRVVSNAAYADAIKQAERDLPGDEWIGPPMRHNASRSRREGAVAQGMLAEVSPELKRMSVTQLVRSLKVTSRFAPDDFAGVAGCVYQSGNAMIIAEIQARPKSELKVLPSLGDQWLDVYEGPQGPGDSLDFVIHDRILKDRW